MKMPDKQRHLTLEAKDGTAVAALRATMEHVPDDADAYFHEDSVTFRWEEHA